MKKKSPATARTKGKPSSSRRPKTRAAAPDAASASAPPDAAGEPDKPKHPVYLPSRSQTAYLVAMRERALDGLPTSDKAMAAALKMSRTTIWEWKHDPGFLPWLISEMKSEHDADFEAAMARHHRLAIQGSVRSFEAIARVRSIGQKGGGFTPEAVLGPGDYTVNLLVPRPPELPADGGGQ